MSRPAISLLVYCGLLTTALAAQAAERRVAVVQGDAELLRSLTLALSPWGVETIRSNAAPPESSQPQAVLQAAALARQLAVDGLVWIAQSDRGSVLWVYDARTGEATTRVLAEAPPFESVAAAGIALSVKTALRASVEPSAAERVETDSAASTSHARRERVTLKLGADAHFIADDKTQARLALSSVVWLTSRPRLGAGLSLAGGRGVGISTSTFAGRYRDLSFGPALHLRLLGGPRLAASLFVGGAVHASLLDGTVVQESTQSAIKRYNLSVDAGAQLDLRLGGGAYIGVGAQASYLPAYQRYLVGGTPVFSPWPVTASAGGHCGVELF